MSHSNILFTFEDGSQLYAMKAKWLTEIPVWEANRLMDESHVATLEAAIKSAREIQGPFSVVTYNTEAGEKEHRIIDGQHRQEILRRFFVKDPTADDFMVLCRRYVIADRNDAIAIFQQINNAKPMVYKGSAVERLQHTVTALRRHFVVERNGAGAIIAMIRPSCNRPALSIEYLESALKLYGIEKEPHEVVAHAEKMNQFYAADPSRIPAKFTANTLEKARDLQFYLGLDTRCTWLVGLK